MLGDEALALEFQSIPKLLDGLEVRAQWRPVKFFHCKLRKPVIFSCSGGIVMLKQEKAKLLSQIWKHTIV